ncbi:uncharacterized protein LOC144424425 [Styela clava]
MRLAVQLILAFLFMGIETHCFPFMTASTTEPTPEMNVRAVARLSRALESRNRNCAKYYYTLPYAIWKQACRAQTGHEFRRRLYTPEQHFASSLESNSKQPGINSESSWRDQLHLRSLVMGMNMPNPEYFESVADGK